MRYGHSTREGERLAGGHRVVLGRAVAAGACAATLALGLAGPVTAAEEPAGEGQLAEAEDLEAEELGAQDADTQAEGASVSGESAASQQASGRSSSEVRQEAAAQNARLDELVAQLEAGKEEVDGLEQQIRELAEQSIVVQGTLIEDRSQLSTMVQTDYRWGGMPSLWSIALSSQTFDDFISRVYYANKVTQWQTQCVEQLRADKQELDDRMNQIEIARNERREALKGLEQTCDELSESVASLLELAEGLEAEERAAEQARLAQIARQAAIQQERAAAEREQAEAEAQVRSLANQAATDAESLEERAEQDDELAAQAKAEAQKASEDVDEELDSEEPDGEDEGDADDESEAGDGSGEESDDAAGDDEAAAADEVEDDEAAAADEVEDDEAAEVADDAEQAEPEPVADEEPEPEPEPEPAPEAESEVVEETTSDYAGDWITCIASAYSIADNTPPGSTATASGIPLDESVPTVAMPISSNPSRFYGSMIQIEYNGMTVIATVTDCGGMGGGSRGLDLTPAVFRALGASSCDEWGLREVRYRFL